MTDGAEDGTPAPNPRERLRRIIDSRAFSNFVVAVIIINAIDLGLQTWDEAVVVTGGILLYVDEICIAIFVVELSMRGYVRRWRFFHNGWNIFDSVIVGIALLPGADAFSVLRAFRVLRIFRLLSQVSSMRLVSESAISALPALGSTFLVLALVYYVFAIICTSIFGSAFPQWFGNIGESLYSLFQVMTLESWSMGIVRPVREVFPYAWLVFIPFIMLTAFIILNIVVAIMVDSVNSTKADMNRGEDAESPTPELVAPLAELSGEIARLSEDVRGLRREVEALKDGD